MKSQKGPVSPRGPLQFAVGPRRLRVSPPVGRLHEDGLLETKGPMSVIPFPLKSADRCWPALGVLLREVVDAADGWPADGVVASVMLVGVDPVGKGGGAFVV